MFKYLIIFILVLASLFPSMGQAAAIGVHPEAFAVHQQADERLELSFVVYNTGEEPAIYTVSADDYERLLAFDLRRFRLEPGEHRTLRLTTGPFPPGEFTTFLSVMAQDVENRDTAKTGVKVPVHVTSQGAREGFFQIEALVVSLIFLALFLLIGSFWVQKRLSPAARLADAAEETLLSHSSYSWFKHYRKRHVLILVSFIAITLALFLLVLSYAIPYSSTLLSHRSEQEAAQVLVEIRTPDQTYVANAKSDQPLSAFTALQQVAQETGIALRYDPPNEFGVLVTEVAGYKNGQDGKYWVYERNGKKVPVAADKQQLETGDLLLWKFVVPE